MEYRQYLKPAFPKHYDKKFAETTSAIIDRSKKKQGTKPCLCFSWPKLVWLDLNFRNDISCIRSISAANIGTPADKVPIFARSRGVELGARSASRRFVSELALFWRRIDGLTLDGTAAWACARFRGVETGQENIPAQRLLTGGRCQRESQTRDCVNRAQLHCRLATMMACSKTVPNTK